MYKNNTIIYVYQRIIVSWKNLQGISHNTYSYDLKGLGCLFYIQEVKMVLLEK